MLNRSPSSDQLQAEINAARIARDKNHQTTHNRYVESSIAIYTRAMSNETKYQNYLSDTANILSQIETFIESRQNEISTDSNTIEQLQKWINKIQTDSRFSRHLIVIQLYWTVLSDSDRQTIPKDFGLDENNFVEQRKIVFLQALCNRLFHDNQLFICPDGQFNALYESLQRLHPLAKPILEKGVILEAASHQLTVAISDFFKELSDQKKRLVVLAKFLSEPCDEYDVPKKRIGNESSKDDEPEVVEIFYKVLIKLQESGYDLIALRNVRDIKPYEYATAVPPLLDDTEDEVVFEYLKKDVLTGVLAQLNNISAKLAVTEEIIKESLYVELDSLLSKWIKKEDKTPEYEEDLLKLIADISMNGYENVIDKAKQLLNEGLYNKYLKKHLPEKLSYLEVADRIEFKFFKPLNNKEIANNADRKDDETIEAHVQYFAKTNILYQFKNNFKAYHHLLGDELVQAITESLVRHDLFRLDRRQKQMVAGCHILSTSGKNELNNKALTEIINFLSVNYPEKLNAFVDMAIAREKGQEKIQLLLGKLVSAYEKNDSDNLQKYFKHFENASKAMWLLCREFKKQNSFYKSRLTSEEISEAKQRLLTLKNIILLLNQQGVKPELCFYANKLASDYLLQTFNGLEDDCRDIIKALPADKLIKFAPKILDNSQKRIVGYVEYGITFILGTLVFIFVLLPFFFLMMIGVLPVVDYIFPRLIPFGAYILNTVISSIYSLFLDPLKYYFIGKRQDNIVNVNNGQAFHDLTFGQERGNITRFSWLYQCVADELGLLASSYFIMHPVQGLAYWRQLADATPIFSEVKGLVFGPLYFAEGVYGLITAPIKRIFMSGDEGSLQHNLSQASGKILIGLFDLLMTPIRVASLPLRLIKTGVEGFSIQARVDKKINELKVIESTLKDESAKIASETTALLNPAPLSSTSYSHQQLFQKTKAIHKAYKARENVGLRNKEEEKFNWSKLKRICFTDFFASKQENNSEEINVINKYINSIR